jgi:prepilin-type N-terminal cleavage/methylation domain-containing protein
MKPIKNHILTDRRGFTLFELIIVLVIIAIFAGTIGVVVDDVNDNTRISNAAARALADVRYAAEMAMTYRRVVHFTVLEGSNKYEAKWHSGSFLASSLDGSNMVVQFGDGEYKDVTITSTGLSGRLSFSSIGEPFISDARFGTATSVMCLNSEVHVVVYPSGHVALQRVEGGTGC